MERRNFYFMLIIVLFVQEIYSTKRIFTCGKSMSKQAFFIILKKIF